MWLLPLQFLDCCSVDLDTILCLFVPIMLLPDRSSVAVSVVSEEGWHSAVAATAPPTLGLLKLLAVICIVLLTVRTGDGRILQSPFCVPFVAITIIMISEMIARHRKTEFG